MAKKSKYERHSPNLSPLVMLRPRLDGLIENPAWLQRGSEAARADLDAVTRGIQPADSLPIVLRAFADISSSSDPRNNLLTDWLNQHQFLDDIQELIEKDLMPGNALKRALSYLEAADIKPVINPVGHKAASFYRAFYGTDSMGSQAFLIIFWYTNRQKSRVSGINFLRDFNPPWDGSIKDAFQLPQRSPQDGVRDYVDRMRQGPVTIREIDAIEAKQLMFEGFRCNQTQGLRPSNDTVNLRNAILDQLFTLPDNEKTTQFSVDELDAIFTIRKTADEVMHYEKTVGRKIRTDDGKELLIMGSDDDWNL